jgi:hypothetical protein
MTKEISQRYRISITHTTEKDLEALRYAFEGKMEHGEHLNCSDDVLVAALLGWHLRALDQHSDFFAKALLQEFSIRQELLKDSDSSWVEERHRKARSFFRGSPSTEGNVLTIDGIDMHTIRRIETRAHAVKNMVRKLNEGMGRDAYIRLARYSDQAIIDLGIWWTLTNYGLNSSNEIEEYPFWIKDEIVGRAQARADYEAEEFGNETVGFPAGGCTTVYELPEFDFPGDADTASDEEILELPALSASERSAFFRQRRILDKDQFWSDERIRTAMEMGL